MYVYKSSQMSPGSNLAYSELVGCIFEKPPLIVAALKLKLGIHDHP